jgi:hypothetical protein
MALAGILSTTAAAAAPVPSAGGQTGDVNAPMASQGRTYLNERGIYKYPNSEVVFQPRTFNLLGPRSASASIFSRPTYWFGSHAAEGHMYGLRNGHEVYVGNVSMVFSHRLANGHFLYTNRPYSYYENVHITGIRPGNGGSVQNWHWSWNKDNWVVNR